MKKTYLNHTLFQKIGNRKKVKMNVLTFGIYEKIFAQHGEDQEKTTDAIIIATTDLSQADIDNLSMPDFNSLENAALEQINRSSEFYFDQDGAVFNPAEPELYDPIDGINKVQYTVPTVKVSRLMKTINNTEKTPYAQSRYIAAACTNIEEFQINDLSVRDWNMLQGRINDFLQGDAGSLVKNQ